jgi:DNA repair protein RadA
MTAESLATADEHLKKTSSFKFFSSGSRGLDSLLGGGFREGRVIGFYGRSNSGKTQLAMQAALSAANEGARVLFVDSEGTFRPERMEMMAKARGWDAKPLLDRVVYVRTNSSSEQMECVRRMGLRGQTSGCRLVAIDTLTRNFSVELPGRTNLANRQGALNVHLSEIARDAYLNSRAYVLTNRVTFGSAHDVGIGGKTVEQMVQAAVRLEREGGRVRGTLDPEGGSALLNLGEAGID